MATLPARDNLPVLGRLALRPRVAARAVPLPLAVRPRIAGSRVAARAVPLPAGSAPLRATVARGGVELVDALAPAWRALCDAAGAEPFLHPDWVRTYLATRAPDARIALVTARAADGELRAVLPLLDEPTRLAGVPLRRWRSVGDLRSPERVDVVCHPADHAAAAAAVWAALRAARGWDLVELAAVPTGAAALALRDRAAADGHPVAGRVALTTPVIALRGPGGAAGEPSETAAFAGTTAKFRANLRRRMRNLEQLGPVRLTRTTAYDDALVDAFLTMEAAGWKGAAGTAIAARPDTAAFFREMARVAAANGWLTIYALTCADRPVAIHLGLTWPGPAADPAPGHPELVGRCARTYGVPKLAYDEALAPLAPGHLLVGEILRDLVARGVDTFDFLAADAPWKREWTDTLLTCERAYHFRRSPRARLAHALRFRLFPVARQRKLALAAYARRHRPAALGSRSQAPATTDPSPAHPRRPA